MGFVLKKIISAFVLPCGIFVSVCFIFFLYFYLKKEKKVSLFFLLFGFFIWVLSSPLVSNYLLSGLEKDFIENDLSGDVIVVLGGNSLEKNGKYFLDQDSMARIAMALSVYKKTKKSIILSGGRVYTCASFAVAARDFLIEVGVNPSDIILEDKSRDTFENAFYVKKICDDKKYKKPLIISEASHLKRAIYLFRQNGFDSIAHCASSFSAKKGKDFLSFLPGSGIGLRIWLHENLGILSYRFFDIISKWRKNEKRA